MMWASRKLRGRVELEWGLRRSGHPVSVAIARRSLRAAGRGDRGQSSSQTMKAWIGFHSPIGGRKER